MASAVPAAVRGDSARLSQIVGNLLDNAIKFTSRGDISIRVEGEAAGRAEVVLHFVVRDTGSGIPEHKQALVFEAFSQADGSYARRYGGTGLGLAIARRLVEGMGGRIWLRSTPGWGSVFHFTARCGIAAIGGGDATMPPDTPEAVVARRPLRVLLAEDNLVNQMVGAKLLQKAGHVSSLI